MTNTFVTIADDSPATMGMVPPQKAEIRTLARLHYDLLSQHPYEYDHDSLNFEVHCLKNQISAEERDLHSEAFFSKGHPCMRASPLTKTYGFGAHYNGVGKIAIYPVDSVAYTKFLTDPDITIVKAMRARRPDTSSSQSAGSYPRSGPQPFKPAA